MKRNCEEILQEVLIPYEGMTFERDEFGWINEHVLIDGVIYHIENGSYRCADKNDIIESTHQAIVDRMVDTETEEFVVPGSVTCGGMTFPVRCIGEMAFCGCIKLRKITFPESLRFINPLAFDQCHRLNNIVLPDKFRRIDFGAFLDCHDLKHISVKNINDIRVEYNAFKGCHKQLKIENRDEK